jgi:hypothetical protein
MHILIGSPVKLACNSIIILLGYYIDFRFNACSVLHHINARMIFCQDMELKVVPATVDDVDRITAIFFAAFDHNTLLHAQFPSPQAINSFKKIFAQETLSAISSPDSKTAVLVVRDLKTKEVISFAKWRLATAEKGDYNGLKWPKGCSKALLKEYFVQTEAARHRVLGDRRCHCESHIS